MGYNLTDKQKELVRWSVGRVRDGKLTEEFHVVWLHAGAKIVEFNGQHPPVTRGTMAALIKAELLFPVEDRGATTAYAITQKAFSAVDNDFELPAQERDQQQQRVGEPRSEQPDFSFMTDPDLRAIIERDYAEIPSCLGAGAWKAATVMCGSVMEALLLDALLIEQARARQSDKAAQDISDLRRWTLNTMIKLAVDLQILPSDTLGFMSQTVREYRNLIHPAVETRKKITAEREEANAARAAVDLVIKQLS